MHATVTGTPVRLSPADLLNRRCETADGVPLDPLDVAAAAVAGHVRRVVFDSAGVVINLGRKRRLFSSSARDAALMRHDHRLYPGCRCRWRQIDHTQPWTNLGATNQHSSSPQCGWHNRWATHGYKVWRDQQGHWRTTRPDGTEITAT